MTDRAAHWDGTYTERGAEDVSWFQAEARPSLDLVEVTAVGPDEPVLDVGGGASPLAAGLVARGHRDVTVLDISAAAVDLARHRVPPDAGVSFVVADVLRWTPTRRYGLWHDRAVFHFLTDPDERDAYLRTLRAAVPDGAVVLGTFASDGPETCSGLPVVGYDADELAALLHGFHVLEARRHVHVTPRGVEQPFTFVAARRSIA